MVTVGIIGAAGYTGGELIRLLQIHPKAKLQFALSRTYSGKPVSDIHTDLWGETDLKFTDTVEKTDVLFLCLPHKESKTWLQENPLDFNTKIIDLGNDFRLEGSFELGEFVYGLPEFQKEAIQKAQYIANPGCFATAIQLALLPLAQKNVLNEVYTTGITGSTGAGQSLSPTSHFSWRANNISAYKTLTHQHLGEIKKTLNSYNNEVSIQFVPWRGDFTRGIYTSSTIKTTLSLDELYALYESFYADAAFVTISKKMIDLKQVVNTNKALVHIEKQDDFIVVHSAIDNLLKGASGQAIQNMNLMMGWEENTGLQLKANAF